MHKSGFPTLKIGNLEINPPIIQGGMGVRISMANLAAAVANEGCVGVIASVCLGRFEELPGSEFVRANEEALRREIRKARRMSKGVIGVNVMVALSNYENLVNASVEEGADLIISGAGLPLDLPKLTKGKDIKLAPIVSSAKAFRIICKKWQRNFNRIPDAVIVEGEKAGGHLGFSPQQLKDNTAPTLESIVSEVVDTVKSMGVNVPVIPAGGIFDGKDISRFLALGASGVQMATRFVCTTECDAPDKFKQAYLNAKKEDLVIISSPVGMPGRVIKNSFVEKINRGETATYICNFHCLRTCDPKPAPYCIARVLANAADGNLDEAFVFAGSNAYRCNEIIPVKKLIEQLIEEASRE